MKLKIARIILAVSTLLAISLVFLTVLQEHYVRNQRKQITHNEGIEEISEPERQEKEEDVAGFTLEDLERMEQDRLKKQEESSDEPLDSTEESSEWEMPQSDPFTGNTDSISRVSIVMNGDAATERGFTWYTEDIHEAAFNEIQIVEATSEAIVFEKGMSVKGYTEMVSEQGNLICHKALVQGLKENTKYYYRIGDSEQQKWCDVGSFSTESQGNYTFVYISDTQSELGQYNLTAKVIKSVLNENKEAAFLVHTGDIVDDGASEEHWKELFDSEYAPFRNITLVPAAGNHVSDHQEFARHYNLKSMGSDTEKGVYYSFDYGCAHYVVLNTNISSSNISCVGEEQLEWMRHDVTEAKAKGSKWIIVVMHKGCYTVGMHAEDSEISGDNGIRKRFAVEMEELGVDLVLQGHDHFPTCTGGILNGYRNARGTIYLETGAMGPRLHEKDTSLEQSYLSLFDYIEKSGRPEGVYRDFAKVEVAQDRLVIEMREMNTLKNANKSYVIYRKELIK